MPLIQIPRRKPAPRPDRFRRNLFPIRKGAGPAKSTSLPSWLRPLLLVLFFIPFVHGEPLPPRGELLYQNNLAEPKDVVDWVMEGPGKVDFRQGWMEMYSPEEENHHVLWCPEDFPESFIAEWEAQNLDPTYGLCIVFFAAHGENGKDIFDPSLPARDGDFTWYIKDRLNSYHISYYANTPKKPDRGKANLRKNNQFNLVQEGKEGIPAKSTDVHQVKLVKDGPHIRMFIDGRKIIDWTDTGENEPRPYYREGKIGFRQMQWTHFRYRNFRVWEIERMEERLETMKDLPVIHPKNRIWREPQDNAVAERNPPTLMWPPSGEDETVYEVRLSQNPAFPKDAIMADRNRRWALYNPYEKLSIGKWFWQYRERDKTWSSVESFLITEKSQPWSPPSAWTLSRNIPDYHPRVLVDAPAWESFRARARGTPEAGQIISLAEEAFEHEIPSEGRDILSIKGETAKKTDKLQKDASRAIGQKIFQAVGPLCKAYVLTGNPRYAELAKNWALEAATWDPHGVTTINNFGDSRIMLSMALVVDTLQSFLNREEKAILVDATAARAGRFYRKWKNGKEAVVLSNHIWQHIFHYFFDTAIALKGEHPEAKEWLSYLYDMFLARAPILGGKDGGWVHGMSYFRMNFETLVDIPLRIKQYTGFDFIQHTPWYWENPYYFIYGFPPGSYGTGFADNSHDLPEPRGDYLAYADALSRLVQNPYAAWYRDRITRVSGNLTPHYQDYWKFDYVVGDTTAIQLGDTSMLQWARLKYLYDLPPAEPIPPVDLPRARAFHGVGLVTMHSQALDQPADGNLYLAMRSSPFGGYSHMLADNNAFNMVYGGDRLFYHVGYKVAMSAPHRKKYYKHTQSHNSILINGEGQTYTTDGYAWVENFLSGKQLSYAVGNASNAYKSIEDNIDTGLKTFKRHVLMLRPDIVIIYDELEADEPSEWSYLLHSYYEMTMDPEDRLLSAHNKAGRARVHLYASGDDQWSVTDEYPVPAYNWRGIKDEEGNLKTYSDNAWHFKAATEKVKKMRFLAFYQVRPHGEAEEFNFNEIRIIGDDTYRIGSWKVIARMNPENNAGIKIINTLDGVAFSSSGEELEAPALEFKGNSSLSAKLAERRKGEWVLRESMPEIPPGAEIAIKHQRTFKK